MSTDPCPAGRPPGPPRRRSNIFGKTAESEQAGGYRNPHLFKPTCTPEKPYWDDKDRAVSAVTTVRLLPQFAEDGSWLPAREFNEYGEPDFTDWLNRFYYCALPGSNDRSGGGFIVFDPDDPDIDLGRIRFENPASMIHQGIKRAVEADKGEVYWGRLISKDNRDRFGRPNWAYFAYGLVYGRGGDERNSPPRGLRGGDRKPIVLHLNNQVGEGISRMVRLAREGCDGIYEGHAPEGVPFEKLFVAPDPVDLRRGLLFRVTQLKAKDPRPSERAAAKVPWWMDVPDDEGREAGAYGYDVYATREATLLGKEKEDEDIVVRPAIAEEHWEKLARRHAMPIRDHLLFPDQVKQLQLLIAAIRKADGGYCGDLFRYIFREHDLFSAVVEDALTHVEQRTRVFDPASRDDRRAVRNGDGPEPAAARTGPAPPPDDEPDDDDEAPQARRPAAAAEAPIETRGTSRAAARRLAATPAPAAEPSEEEDDDLGEDEAPPPRRGPAVHAAGPDEDLGDDDLDDPDAGEDAGEDEPPPPVRRPAPASERSAKQKLEDLRLANLSSKTQQ